MSSVQDGFRLVLLGHREEEEEMISRSSCPFTRGCKVVDRTRSSAWRRWSLFGLKIGAIGAFDVNLQSSVLKKKSETKRLAKVSVYTR